MQHPLNNPNRTAADANGNVRILAINLNTLLNGGPEALVRQYLYRIPVVPNNERATDKLYEVNVAGATDLTPFENAAGKLISDPTKTLEQLNTAGLAALGITPVTKSVVIDSLTAIDPLLERVEGVCVVGNHIAFTYDNDFNVGDVASIPANPNPNGPLVQLELLGTNYAKISIVPLP
jgi:hypothetical protein